MAVTLGVAWMAGFYGLAALGVEPVATFFFLFAWAGLLYTFDQLIARAEGHSLMARLGAAPFALLMAWSSFLWFAFELANLRLRNWHYVMVTDVDAARLAGTVLAFGTVLPGVFWIDHWLGARGVAASARLRPLRFGLRFLLVLQAAGAVSLVLCLLDPTRFYPLIWGVAPLSLAPMVYRRGADGWLRQWERGEYGPTLRMLLAGAIAGGFWEFFNFWARAKWIYTVPFFDELKLFEMPLLGFLGFPPFALGCATVYRLLVWHRLAPPFGCFAQQGPAAGRLGRAAAVAAAVVVSGTGYLAVDRVVVTSRTPRVADAAAIGPEQRQALKAAGVSHLTQLTGWRSERRWAEVQAMLGDSSAADLRRVVALYLHQGIGTEYGNRLVAAGVTSLESLRGWRAGELWERLRAEGSAGRVPTRAQVKVWVRRLPWGSVLDNDR